MFAEAGRRAEYDGIVVAEFAGLGDGRRLVELHAGILRDLLGHQLGHALDGDLAAGDLAGTRRDGLGHGLHVAVGTVVEHENFGHGSFLPLCCGWVYFAWRRNLQRRSGKDGTALKRYNSIRNQLIVS